MQQASNSTEGAQQVAPHQLANELTADKRLQETERRPDTRRPKTSGNVDPSQTTRVERRVGRWVALVVLAAVVLGLLISAALFQEWLLVGIGALVLVPFILFVSAPVWLAGVTKSAQDETVREQRDVG